MSLNLSFIAGEYYIEFPFQTPTDLSLKVIETDSIDERVKLVHEHLDLRFDDTNDEWIEEQKEECERMLRDKKLRLVIG